MPCTRTVSALPSSTYTLCQVGNGICVRKHSGRCVLGKWMLTEWVCSQLSGHSACLVPVCAVSPTGSSLDELQTSWWRAVLRDHRVLSHGLWHTCASRRDSHTVLLLPPSFRLNVFKPWLWGCHVEQVKGAQNATWVRSQQIF